MPRGQPTPIETRIEAVAELEAGATQQEVADKYGVSIASIQNWKRDWDEHGFADAAEEEVAAKPKPEPKPAPKAAAPAQKPAPKPKPEPEAPALAGPFITQNGLELPPEPPQAPGAERRSFPESFRFTVGAAIRDGHVSYAEISGHYNVHFSVVRKWVDAVTQGRIKGRLAKPKGSTMNGASNARAQESEPRSELVLAEPAHPPTHALNGSPEIAAMKLELMRRADQIEQLKAENARLKEMYRGALELAGRV